MEARTTVTVATEAHRLIKNLAKSNGWSVADAAQTAFEALEILLDLHSRTADKAAEPDVGKLFVELSRLMPAGLVEGKRTEWGRLSDSRPALIVDGWVFARDLDGAMMAVRHDGSQVGHIGRGQVEPPAEPEAPTVEQIAALN